MKIGELFIALGFDVDDGKLKGFDDKIKGAQQNLIKLGAAATATLYGLNRFLNEGVKSATALKNFEEQTGYAKEQLLEFYNVASRANTDLTLDQVIAGYTELGNVIAGIQRGEFPEGAAWMNFGLSVADEPGVVIDKIRDAIPRLMSTVYSGTNGQQLLKRDLDSLGLGQFVQSFLLPQEKWEEWRKKRMPTSEQWKSMERMAMAYREFRHEYMLFKMSLGERIAPHFEQFIHFVSYTALPVLEDFIYNALTQLGPKIKDFGLNMAEVGKIIGNFASSFDVEINESSGLLLGLALLYARVNPLRWAVIGLVSALNELGKMQRGEENWVDKSLDSAAALATQIPGGRNIDWVKDRIKKQGLKPEDFGLDIVGQGIDFLNKRSAESILGKEGVNERNASFLQKYAANQTINHITVQGVQDPMDFYNRLQGYMNNVRNMPENVTLDMLYGASGNAYSGAGG